MENEVIRENFDLSHYLKVKNYRENHGLKTLDDYNPNNGLIENHPLKGTTFWDKKDNRLVHVQNVYKHWHMGYYIVLLTYTWSETYNKLAYKYNMYKSHGNIFWENISCHDDIIVNDINKNKKRYIKI